VVLSPDGTRAYVSSRRGTVTVIDTASNTVVATVAVAGSPGAEAISSDGSRLFVSTATNAVVVSLTVGDDPGGIAVTSASAGNFLVTVSGSQGYGSSSPTFSTMTSPPAGDNLNGTVTCVTVDRPARLISPILPPGAHTINGTSCSGLTLSGPTASDFEVNYRGGPFTVGPIPPGVCVASPAGGSGSGSGTIPCETSTTVSVVAGATAAPGVSGLPATGRAEGIPLAGGAGLIVVVLGLRGLRRLSDSATSCSMIRATI
jgi:YVTN family beta-propeller protein